MLANMEPMPIKSNESSSGVSVYVPQDGSAPIYYYDHDDPDVTAAFKRDMGFKTAPASLEMKRAVEKHYNAAGDGFGNIDSSYWNNPAIKSKNRDGQEVYNFYNFSTGQNYQFKCNSAKLTELTKKAHEIKKVVSDLQKSLGTSDERAEMLICQMVTQEVHRIYNDYDEELIKLTEKEEELQKKVDKLEKINPRPGTPLALQLSYNRTELEAAAEKSLKYMKARDGNVDGNEELDNYKRYACDGFSIYTQFALHKAGIETYFVSGAVDWENSERPKAGYHAFLVSKQTSNVIECTSADSNFSYKKNVSGTDISKGHILTQDKDGSLTYYGFGVGMSADEIGFGYEHKQSVRIIEKYRKEHNSQPTPTEQKIKPPVKPISANEARDSKSKSSLTANNPSHLVKEYGLDISSNGISAQSLCVETPKTVAREC